MPSGLDVWDVVLYYASQLLRLAILYLHLAQQSISKKLLKYSELGLSEEQQAHQCL